MKNFKGRPTTDFARESLFNLLRSRVDLKGARVLDLFAGTGMVGIECASRGAESVTAVEMQRSACAYIKESYSALSFDEAVVINSDVFSFVKKGFVKYDFVFADPPYDLKKLAKLPGLVRDSGLLAEGGLFCLEHGESNSFDGVEGFLERRKYGHVNFSFFTFES